MKLTSVEQRIAKVVVENYPQSALLTSRLIASRAGVSPPSVTRFARKLGYVGFAEMQDALRLEMRARLSSPSARLTAEARGRRRSPDLLLRDAIGRNIDNMQRTLDLVDPEVLEAFVRALIGDARKKIYITGSKKAGIVADYFAMQLNQLRPDVVRLYLSDTLADQTMDLTDADILVVFEPRRATRALVGLVKNADDIGATIAAFCDEDPPSVLRNSDFLFVTPIAAISVFHSYAGLFTLCDAILAAVVERRSRSVSERAHRLESLNLSFRTWDRTS